MKYHKEWYLTQTQWNRLRKKMIRDSPDQLDDLSKTIKKDIMCHSCNKIFNIPYYGAKYGLCPDCLLEFQFWFSKMRSCDNKPELTQKKLTNDNIKLFLSEIYNKRYDVSCYV